MGVTAGLLRRLGRPALALIKLDNALHRDAEKPEAQWNRRDRLCYQTIQPSYRRLSEHLMTRTFIRLLIALRVRPLMTSGQIRIHGLERYKEAIDQGKGVLLISNHPSLAETVLLPAVLWRELLTEGGFDRYFPYGTPDDSLFPSMVNEFGIRYSRFIPVNRSEEGHNRSSMSTMMFVLKQGKTVVMFAEGGRTYKYQQRGQRLLTGELLPSGRYRQIAELPDMPARLAQKTGCQIMTVYVDLPREWSTMAINEAIKLCLCGDMSHVDIYFGQTTIKVDKPDDRSQQDLVIRQATELIEQSLLFPSTAFPSQQAV